MIFDRQRRRHDLRVGDERRPRQRAATVDVMLGNAGNRFERDIVGHEIFDRDGGRDIVVGLRLRSCRQTDQIGLDVADLAVGRDHRRQQLDADIAGLGGGLARQQHARGDCDEGEFGECHHLAPLLTEPICEKPFEDALTDHKKLLDLHQCFHRSARPRRPKAMQPEGLRRN